MEDNLIMILEEFGYPVYRQGSLTEDTKYPATFITFWNSDSADHAHYDNDEYGTVWNFDVYVYSNNPALTYSLLDNIKTQLKRNKWIVSGRGYDVTSDEPTHTGRGLNVNYLEI